MDQIDKWMQDQIQNYPEFSLMIGDRSYLIKYKGSSILLIAKKNIAELCKSRKGYLEDLLNDVKEDIEEFDKQIPT